MKKLIISMLPDALMVFGSGVLSFGTWLIYAPAGYIVAGALLILGGVMVARAGVE